MSETQPKVIDDIMVVKVGTSTLTRKYLSKPETLDLQSFKRIGEQVIKLQEEGLHVVLVSSGAITAGMIKTGVTKRPDKKTEMPELQALASVGWRPILNVWDRVLHGEIIGELLLTKHELSSDLPQERGEALSTAHTLLRRGFIPIANENDAISHEEIAFGDNDILSATFVEQIGRSALFGNNIRLVSLTDVDGVYEDPKDPSSIIRTIDNIDDYSHLAGPSDTPNGTGGMCTKFEAAKIVTAAGIDMWVANGKAENAIPRALAGEIGTHFVAKQVVTA